MMKRPFACTIATVVLVGCSDPTGISDFTVRMFEGSGAAIAGGGKCVAPPSELLAWWAGEGDATDQANGNDGTTNGGVSYELGHVQQAFVVDGVSGYVDASGTWLSAITSEITVELWARPETPPTGSGWIFARRVPFKSEGFGIIVRSNGSLAVVVRTTASGSNVSTFSSAAGAITFDAFQHIAVTASTSSGLVHAYVDGEPVSLSVTAGPATLSGSLAAVTTLFVGRRQSSSTIEGTRGGAHYRGSLDEVTVYSAALTAEEVRAIAQAGSAGKCLTNGYVFEVFEIDRAHVVLNRGSSYDRFSVQGRFALAEESDGIDPLTEEVTFGFGTFTQTVSGFFRDEEDGSFVFHGPRPGIRHLIIHDDGEFRVDAEDVDLSGTDFSGPVVVWLQIGNDGGVAEVWLDEVTMQTQTGGRPHGPERRQGRGR